MTATPDDAAEALRLARRELKLARGRQETAEETLQQVRRQRAALREQARLSSEALARVLSERYWAGQPGAGGGLVARLRPGRTEDRERAMVAEVEASEYFDGGWYLRHHPEAVRDLVAPAVHYVRTGGAQGAEPGPRFDSDEYLRDHPEARDSGLPPLVHHERHARA